MNLLSVEKDLKACSESLDYNWGVFQNNAMDYVTNFIYKINTFDKLTDRIKDLDPAMAKYASIRWYNFTSAMAVEYIFQISNKVRRNPNPYSKEYDFKIFNTQFDHKTTVLPKVFRDEVYPPSKTDLILWLYRNQSKGGRFNNNNRIFLVVPTHKEKAEILTIKDLVLDYLNDYSIDKCVDLGTLDHSYTNVLSDIIFYEPLLP